MKVQLNKIVNSIESLNELLKQELPIKKAYWLGKAAKQMASEIQNFEEQRRKLVMSLGEEEMSKAKKGEKPQPTGNWKVKPENVEEYQKKLNELLEIEVDIQLDPFKLEELGLEKLKPTTLMLLDYLIIEE